MIDKKTASRVYAMNQMGMGPKPRKGNKKSSETVTCTSEKPGSCGMERGEVRRGGSVKQGKKSSDAGGEKNKVMKPGTFAYKRHQKKLENVRGKSDRSKF